jgi:FkbH-like protein
MSEPVRLVIWDLDETFWKGTLTEGGIEEYLVANHDLVIELARRGIMSSICSKNDAATVSAILREKGIEEFFIFPSISWEPKGLRLASLIDTIQLRPATVMFIDDNPNNRAEARAIVPGLQVEDETFIARMLDDPRFHGKDDRALSRLAQYKLLETRKQDEQATSGGNIEFLRQCDVRVRIEYDVLSQLDRAVELISRTNQLNYTKLRLPEDPEAAQAELRQQIAPFYRQAGLIHVMDKYGDYGYVGFFLTETMRTSVVDGAANARLVHFCFSCRTLGMLVEQWVYDHLRRPELTTVGEVLTDLSVPRTVDWIRLVQDFGTVEEARQQTIPKIVLWGGCEANAIGLYLSAHTPALEVYGNYVAGDLFIRLASAMIANDMAERDGTSFSEEAARLGLPSHLSTLPVFEQGVEGAAYIFNCSFDAFQNIPIYRHRQRGWLVHLEPRGMDWIHLDQCSDERLKEILANHEHLDDGQRARLFEIGSHVAAHYENARPFSEDDYVAAMHALIGRVPLGAKFIIALDHDEVRDDEDQIHKLDHMTCYANAMRMVAASYDYVGVVSFTDVLDSQAQIQRGGGSHYDRRVYLEYAERVMATLAELSPRTAGELSKLADSFRAKQLEDV